MSISVTFDDGDIRGLLRHVEDMEGRIRAAVQKVVTRYAYKIDRTAKQLCPVDTGRLRSSIHVELERFAATVGTNVEYAPFVEFGTSRSPAQPYLLPAFEEHKGDLLRELREAIRA